MKINGYQMPPGIELQDDERAAKRLEECLSHARSSSFKDCLENLGNMAKGHPGSKVRVFLDFAPLSFVWSWILSDGSVGLHGGLIFHSSSDGYGSGGAPTFSVSLTNEEGWQLHT